MLLNLLLLACSSSDPGNPSVEEKPHTLPAVYSQDIEQPLAKAMLDFEANPRRKLWMFEQQGDVFIRLEPHIGKDISSLGALVMGDRLYLTGICWWPGCGSEEEMHKRQQYGPLVFGLSTSDLQEWTAHQWRLVDEKNYTPIDPQLNLGPKGLELWYFGAAGQKHTDPMDRSQHDIRKASLGEDSRFHHPSTYIRKAGLADPSPIVFQNTQWLFATQFAAESIVAYRGNPPQQSHRFQGVSVPFAMTVENELWLLATRIVNGRQQSVRSISTDGEHFSDFEPFLPTNTDQVCASPVGAVFNGKTVIFCVEEPTRPG